MAKSDSRQIYKTGFSQSKNVIHLNDEDLKKVKSILLCMFSEITEFMQSEGIEYSLSGGSVIGAVRHGGFIPWDDDIDLNMTRENFDKLRNIFSNKLAEKYILCTPEDTPAHGIMCSQIKLKETIYCSFNELSKDKSQCGLCIDIFVMENLYNNKILRFFHGIQCLVSGYAVTCKKTYLDFPYICEYLTKGTDAYKAFYKKAKIGRYIPFKLDFLVKKTASCYKKCNNSSSKYVTIPSGRGHYFGEMQQRTDICTFSNASFENIQTWIPSNYDKYLSKLYGSDYMTLPPVEKRESHPIMKIDLGPYK